MKFDSKKDYDNFLKYLYTLSEEKYKNFHRNLVKDTKIIGIRVPVLKKIAKEISKSDYLNFIKYNTHQTYEENTLHGLILGYIKVPNDTLFEYLDDFLKYNDNWATNDTTCANLKVFNKIDFKEVYRYINSEQPFRIRFGLVLLLDYYINENNIDKILKICDNINSNEYYVLMANAWLISVCFIKFGKKTYEYLLNNNLDDFTFNKSISKICDSYRIDKETKKN